MILKIDDEILFLGTLNNTRLFTIDRDLALGKHTISLEMLGKTNDNSSNLSDQAIEIESVSFEGIHADRFVWQGQYRPFYPEPWASQQRSSRISLDEVIDSSTYLGWNGIWKLEFEIPIFAWIHRIENLGWVYD